MDQTATYGLKVDAIYTQVLFSCIKTIGQTAFEVFISNFLSLSH